LRRRKDVAEELLETLARRVIDARADYDVAYKARVKAENAKKLAEADLNDAMAKAKLPGCTLALGAGYGNVQFNRESKVNSSVFDEETAIAYFEEKGMLTGYVQGKVRRAPLNQLVRESMENGQELPPGVEPRVTKYVKVTKRK
jgi:hypothetical protein